MKQKTIRVTIILAEDEFESGSNTKVIEGLAVTVDVDKAGLPDKNSAKIVIYNLAMKDMEKLTFLAFRPLQKRKNKILVEAGNVGEKLGLVFKGDITSAYPDFNSGPDIPFEIEAMTAGWSYQIADSPTSIDGEQDVATLMEQFATEAGFGFVNNSVSATVKNTTFTGSPVSKAQQLAQEVNIELLIDDETFTIQTWDNPRGDAVLLSAASGMIGYPSFTQDGVSARSFYNPKLRLGGQVKIQSVVPKASGYWKLTKLSHNLSAYGASPQWQSNFDGIWLKEEEGKEDPKLEEGS
jgi:hypothetical protein